MPSSIKAVLASLVIALVTAVPAIAAPSVPEMAAEVAPGPSGSHPYETTPFKNGLIFAANDGVHGHELWRYDGSSTQLLADIKPGPASSSIHSVQVAGNYAFFLANDGVHGEELWRTDGTPAGTVLLKDIFPGPEDGAIYDTAKLGNSLLFRARDSGYNHELWRSDGTPGGTVKVKEINPGGSSDINNMVEWAGLVYFTATDGGGVTIWKSDGTSAGTVKAVPVPEFTSPWVLTPNGNRLFFEASKTGVGYELWKLEGGVASLVKDIEPGPNSSSPYNLVPIGDKLYFAAYTEATGNEPWLTDGTEAGTKLVKDVFPGPQSSDPGGFAGLGNRVLFSAVSDATGGELWRTDGTGPGTSLLKDINPGKQDSWPFGLTPLGEQLFFFARSETQGYELWKTDGTSASIVKDLLPGADGQAQEEMMIDYFETELIPFNGTLYFTASDGLRGRELWRLAEPKSPPSPKLTIGGGKLKLDAKGRLRVTLSCGPVDASGPCLGTLTLATAKKVAAGAKKKGKLRKRKVALGAKPFNIAPGKSQTVTITVTKSVATLLRANKSARRIKITAQPKTGPAVTRVATVKAAPVKKKSRTRK